MASRRFPLTRKSRDGQLTIGWRAIAPACQPMSRPPLDFRFRKDAVDNEFLEDCATHTVNNIAGNKKVPSLVFRSYY